MITDKSASFLAQADSALSSLSPLEVVERIETLVSAHDAWRQQRLNLNPAESSLSRRARAVLASDLASRLTEGLPGDKEYPHGEQNRFIDEIEGTIIALSRKQFGARFVEWRPVSTTMANAIVFSSLLAPGDIILSQSRDGGGNYSYHECGPAGFIGCEIKNIPTSGNCFEIDLDALALQAQLFRPKMIVIGGSNVLFPYPVSTIRAIADSIGALVLYDAAHLGLLVSHGRFQRPLDEGAHLLTLSTHKIMGGPVGGMIMTNDEMIAERLFKVTFPGFMQTRDQNKYAALAISLSELASFGHELADLMVNNARALARALEAQGFELLGSDRNYTNSHQLFLNLGEDAKKFETQCQAANMLVSDCALTGDLAVGRRTGARIATHEISRLGLQPTDMLVIATLMKQAFDGADPFSTAADVAELLASHPIAKYSFDKDSL